MITTHISEVYSESNISLAISHMESKKDSCGIDGVRLSEVSEYWARNSEKIIDSIMCDKYEVGIVKQYDILAVNRKVRTVSTMNSVDRLIGRALLQIFEPELDKTLSRNCYSYRTGIGTRDMAEKAAGYIENGNKWVLEIDIKNFFDTIPHDQMISCIKDTFTDKHLIHLITSFVRCKRE